ncbi:hypothetical protein CFP56_013603 [Quercus suber]|uniref:Uncharacterized protein n=1 Tax=Quercus suber TaxID=58331 RepID=A0AAW0KV37_QUESU
MAKFPAASVRHLHCFASDHRPILLLLDPNGESVRWKQKPFRFGEIFADAFLFLCKEASPRLVEQFVMVAWCIWECRNRIRLRQQIWGVGAASPSRSPTPNPF